MPSFLDTRLHPGKGEVPSERDCEKENLRKPELNLQCRYLGFSTNFLKKA